MRKTTLEVRIIQLRNPKAVVRKIFKVIQKYSKFGAHKIV